MHDGPVIANNTPLVAFWTIAQTNILRELFGEILIPQAVYEEFLAFEHKSRLAVLQNNSWIKVVPLKNPGRASAFVGLDRGEAEVLALAEEQDARLVLIDERRGRKYAQRLGFPVSGTLGLLLLAKEAGIIPAVLPMVTAIQAAGLYFHPDLVEKVLHIAGESSNR